jgi:hypothetical protein
VVAGVVRNAANVEIMVLVLVLIRALQLVL